MNTNAELDAKVIELDRRQDVAKRLAKLPKLHVTGFDDIDMMPVKNCVVQDLLGEGEFSCVFGKPGSGKSVLVGDLAYHVAAHRKWFGRRVRGGGVLYVAAERAALVLRRFAALRHREGDRGLSLSIVTGAMDLRSNKATVEALAIHAELLTEPPVLIVIDTLSRVLAGGDENSPKDMGMLRDNLLLLQEKTGAHVLIVHHIPADGTQRLRGHGVMLGSFDTTISVEKQADIRVASVDKTNDGSDDQSISFRLESVDLGEDEHGEVTTAPVVVPTHAAATPKGDQACRLPKAAQTALRALAEVLDEQGKAASAEHIPTGVKTVTVAAWRQHSYLRGISTSDEERARQQAFKRSFEHLVGISRVGHWDGLVWLI